jgi:transposase
MRREDTVVMSVKELRRLAVVRQAIERRVTQRQAAGLLGLSVRQVRRLVRRVRREGERGLRHRARGRPSNRRSAPALRSRVLQLYAQHYGDFGPTLAAEKLAARHGLRVSAETLRRWLRAQGVAHFARRPRPHRAWRAREAAVGALVQLDGSHHAWLEGRGPRCVLLAYIDDASSRVWGRFYPYEGTWPALDSFRRYVRRYGVPLKLYADRHTTYKSPAAPSVAEQLEGRRPQSQFGRCLAAVGTELVYAHSPQAKGRVERLFKTLQDRLVKELRLAGIATLPEANRFLAAYLPQFNRRFAVRPAPAVDVHRPLPAGVDLAALLAVKTPRVLRRDWTVAHGGARYQIHDRVRAAQVVAEERLDGSLRFTHQGRALRYGRILVRPPQPEPAPSVRPTPRHVRPAPTHPWNTYGHFARRPKPPRAAQGGHF